MLTSFVLTTSQRDQWVEVIESIPCYLRDIHFHPDYMRIYEITYGEEARLFVTQDGENLAFQPFLVRDIPSQEATTSKLQRDIYSVYGYGGPIIVGPDVPRIRSNFYSALNDYFADEQFVSEFCLLHPILGGQQIAMLAPEIEPVLRKRVIVADLERDVTEIWAGIEERQRKAIAVARRKGVRVVSSDLSDQDLLDFQMRYLKTMENVGASKFWRFPDDYYLNCRNELGRENVTLLHAVYQDEIIASFFHIHMYETVYYHFACSDLKYRNLNPTSLLLFDSLLWAKSAGFKKLHMGGGRTLGEDGLFTFKRSFSGSALPLYGYKRILDAGMYDELVAERVKTGKPIHDETFFPLYRS